LRTLVTGGAGFLGSHISDLLLAHKEHVLVIDNLATGRVRNLEPIDRLEFVEGTIADRGLVDESFERFRPEVVIHAAAAYKEPDNWQEDILTNIAGTSYIAEAARRCGTDRIIYLQTSLCYGHPVMSPIPVEHPQNPFTSYAISKTAGEYYIMLSGVPYVSLRLANIYGARHFSGPIPAFYKRLREGKCCHVTDTRRDFTHVDDFVELIRKILYEKPDVSGAFNVCTGSDVTIEELHRLMATTMGLEVTNPIDVTPPAPDDVATLLLDPSMTRRTFGWTAATSLDEGLRMLIRWFDEHGVQKAHTHLKAGRLNDA